MQTACNTPISPELLAQLDQPSVTARLPGPNEQMYYRPRQLDPLPDINDPEILAQLDKTQCYQPPPDTPESRIAALLPEARGRKLLGCRKKGLAFKYPDGNRSWRPGFPCHMTICCAPCAMDQAADQYSKYAGLTTFIQQRFTRITIPLNVPEHSTVKSCYDSLMKLLRKALPKIPTLAKIKPSSDTVEILCVAPISNKATTRILRAHPNAVIHLHYQSNFSRELHRVTDADHAVFSNPELAALADCRYQKTCLLRTQGLSREERSKLTLIDPIRDNLSEGSGEGQPYEQKPSEKIYHRTASGHFMPVPTCPCGCGSPPTHFACTKSQREPIPDEDWILTDIVTESQRLIELKRLKTQV